jgi:hypothetical protein
MELDTRFCTDCGNPRVWSYDFCQACLDEMDRCQREGLAEDLEDALDPVSRYDNTTLERIAELAERAFWDEHLSQSQRRIMRWAVKKCYEVG